jgi:hypothetical protein
MPENCSLEAIGRVEKMVKEEMEERRRGAILARHLASVKIEGGREELGRRCI